VVAAFVCISVLIGAPAQKSRKFSV
jgi:hypothetical protein